MQVARSRISSVALALSTLVFAAPALPPLGGNVLVVDDDGTAPFTAIQSAVNAAIDGDVVLVRPGNYSGFLVTNKSLVVVGDTGGAVTVQGAVRVLDLAASRTVVLANLLVTGDSGVDVGLASGLDCADNAGIVRAESCSFTGGGFVSSGGVRVRSSVDVSLTGCTLRGGTAVTSTLASAAVDAANSSRVTVYGCELDGAMGSAVSCSEVPPHGHTGGFGGWVRDGFLFGSGSKFSGGQSGDAPASSAFNCMATGSGGTGLFAENADVRLLNCVTIAGQPGLLLDNGCGPCGSLGYAGSAQFGGTIATLPGSARNLHAPTPVIGGTSATIALAGTPGDRVSLLVSETTTPATFVPQWRGMLQVPNPRTGGDTRVLAAGTIPASGQLNYALSLPAAGANARTVFIQGLFHSTQGEVVLSGARSLTALP